LGDNKFSAKAGLANLGAGSNFGYSSNLDNYTNIDIDFNAINKEKEKKAQTQVKKPIEEEIDFGGLTGDKNKAKEEDKFFEDLQEELKKKELEKERQKKSIINTEEDEYNFDNESLNNENLKSNNNTSKNSINITHSDISSTYKHKKKDSDRKNISESINDNYEQSGNGFESISVDRRNNKFEYSQTGSREIYNPDNKDEYLKKQENINDEKLTEQVNKQSNEETNKAGNNQSKANNTSQGYKEVKPSIKPENNNKSKITSEEEDYYDSKFDQLDEIADITSSENHHDDLHKLRSESSHLGQSSSNMDVLEKKEEFDIKRSNQEGEKIQFNTFHNSKPNEETSKNNEIYSVSSENNKNINNPEEKNKNNNINQIKDTKKIESDISNNSNITPINNSENNVNNINSNNNNKSENNILDQNKSNNNTPMNNQDLSKNQYSSNNSNYNNQSNLNNNNYNYPNSNNFNNTYQFMNNNINNPNLINNNPNFNPNLYYNNNPNIPGNNYYNPNYNNQYNNFSNYNPAMIRRNITQLDNNYNKINDVNLGNNNMETPQFNQQQGIIYEDQHKKSFNNISGYKSLYQDQIDKNRQLVNKNQIPNWNNNNSQTDIRDYTNLDPATQEATTKYVATQKIQNFLITPEVKARVFKNIIPNVNNFFSIFCFKVLIG
jgi:hypothetical protein